MNYLIIVYNPDNQSVHSMRCHSKNTAFEIEEALEHHHKLIVYHYYDPKEGTEE